MEKPIKENYGWHNQCGFDDEPSGWMIEGGEEAYNEAMRLWHSMQDNGIDGEDIIDDITCMDD